MKKILTSGKTTGEIAKQLELLYRMRELKQEIEIACDELSTKIGIMNKKLDRQLEETT